MKKRTLLVILLALLGVGGSTLSLLTNTTSPYEQSNNSSTHLADLKNGKTLFTAASCSACHTLNDAQHQLGGGVGLKTPFGTLITPNISADPAQGIGSWSDADFLNAVKAGVSPDGEHYFPGFPYARYRGLSDSDVLDIKAYIFSLAQVNTASKQHEMSFPFNIRRGVGLWKLVNYKSVDFSPAENKSKLYNRGEYLVEHTAHCGECHTPRNIFLGLDNSKAFHGAKGFDGVQVPALNPEYLAAIGSDAFTNGVLVKGIGLNGESLTADKMKEVVENTKTLSQFDRLAIFTFLTHQKKSR